MAGDSGYPRRKSAGRWRPAKGFETATAKRPGAFLAATPEALDVARYIADMTAQLEAMAIAARLDLLAYFLGMSRAEGELLVRTSAPDPEIDLAEESTDHKSID
jgi:hypothetical protein